MRACGCRACIYVRACVRELRLRLRPRVPLASVGVPTDRPKNRPIDRQTDRQIAQRSTDRPRAYSIAVYSIGSVRLGYTHVSRTRIQRVCTVRPSVGGEIEPACGTLHRPRVPERSRCAACGTRKRMTDPHGRNMWDIIGDVKPPPVLRVPPPVASISATMTTTTTSLHYVGRCATVAGVATASSLTPANICSTAT